MFKNYITIAIRNLARHKAYTFINIIGLAIGLTCSTLIFLYLQHEFSYNRHHSKADRIYKILHAQRQSNGNVRYQFAAQGPIAPALAEEFPEIERATRFMHRDNVYVGIEGKEHLKGTTMVADREFFNVFDFPLIEGNVQTGLQTPFSIFVTQSFAKKLFGDTSPIGKTVSVQSKFFDEIYTVTGILQDIPETSVWELSPDLITTTVPLKSAERMKEVWENWQGWGPRHVGLTYSYALLKQGASVSATAEKLPDFVKRHLGNDIAQTDHYELMPLTQLHLHGKYKPGIGRLYRGDINTCYILSFVGLLIVVIACINFMNLTTARSTRRMREVGMRKVVGAKRAQLIYQFLGESILLSTLSLFLSMGITELTLPMLNAFLNIQLSLNMAVLPILLALAIGVGVLAGSYPAFFLSSFKPNAVLKAMHNNKGGHTLVRKALVVVQFAISIILIVGTLVVFQQTEYMRTKNPGYNQDALVMIYPKGYQFDAMKMELLRHAGVHKITITSSAVGLEHEVNQRQVKADGLSEPVNVQSQNADHDFLD
ncbi:MAG: FtsX-like permease family protein, partial [Candidatus Latescibacteria bacterium]|nr:FtsX-like permease family protein [Candidatus Latescibacterota bacterium]